MSVDTGEYARAVDRHRRMTCGNSVGPSAGIQQTVDGLVRRIDFEPGYDCMEHHGDAAGRKCHGRGGMRIRFLLIGEEGAVQFVMVASDWLPGSLDIIGGTKRDKALFGVSGSDLGHHWTRPLYEGEAENGPCDFLCGATCFYDGSGLNASAVLERLLRDGLDAVWEDLGDYYTHCSEQASEHAGSVPSGGDGQTS